MLIQAASEPSTLLQRHLNHYTPPKQSSQQQWPTEDDKWLHGSRDERHCRLALLLAQLAYSPGAGLGRHQASLPNSGSLITEEDNKDPPPPCYRFNKMRRKLLIYLLSFSGALPDSSLIYLIRPSLEELENSGRGEGVVSLSDTSQRG